MTTTLRTLLDRVEKGEGADRYVDACLELMLTPELGEAPWTQPSIGKWVDGTCADNIVYATAYTSSIDAAVALIEKVLPNEMPDAIHAAWSALGQQNHWHIALYREGQMRAFPRALLAATLRAKIAQEERT